MVDYSDEQRREILARAAAALESSGETLKDLQERDMANKEARLLGETRSEAPTPPPPIPPPRRPPQDGRNWVEESRYIEEVATPVIDRKLEANNEMLAEAIGQASAEASNALQAKLRAETRAAVEGLRAEMMLKLAEALTGMWAAAAGDGGKLDERLRRLDEVLAKLEGVDDLAATVRAARAWTVN